jgi:hypothetical protein
MTDKNYEDYILESAETRRDLDVVLTPIFGSLKKAFGVIFGSEGFTKSDFKRYSDLVFYQGGYPKPDSLPKAAVLAKMVATLLKLEAAADKDQLSRLLGDHGITVEITSAIPDGFSQTTLTDKEAKELRQGWEGAGIDVPVPSSRQEALLLMLDKAHNIQGEIIEQSDAIKVSAAEKVESLFKIKKTNFMKAVGLASVRLRKGEGKMQEKMDDVHDQIANLEDALKPLSPRGD